MEFEKNLENQFSSKRIYKDSLFRAYFREPKNFVELCNAVTGLNIKVEDIQENSVENILFNNPRNDVSFSVGEQCFVFFEHQSTQNFNMPLRMLYYLIELYRSKIPEDLIYKEKIIKLPAPKFFMFYNGEKIFPEKFDMHLSDAFSMIADIELTVHFYNVNYDKNFYLIRECIPIHDYSFLIKRIADNRRNGMGKDKSIIEAMQYCIEKNIMRDFLNKHKSEAFEMVNLVWNEEAARKSYIEQGIEKGIEQGIEEKGILVTLNMLKKKMSFDLISEITDLPIEKIKSIAKDNELL